jgi:predicted phage terminase large subunit-like protein
MYQKVLLGLQDLSEAHRKIRVRDLARTDLYFLLVYVLRRPDADHEFVFNRCREVQASPDNHIDLWARGHYKSTVITFAYTIFEILNDPELTFGIFSFNRPIAKQFLRQIKTEFETNAILKWAFDDILFENPKAEALKWSEDDGITVKRKGNPKEATIEAWGLVDGQPTSKHFKRLVYDDVVTDSSVTTADQIKKTTASWSLSRNLVSKDAKTRIIGTRYHYFDTYDELIKRGFKVRRYQATKDGQVKGEPWLLTLEQLADKLREMGSETFASQMMQEPRLDADAYYKPEWFKRYVAKPKLADLRIYGGSDFAVTKQGGDYTVHLIVGIDADDNIYVLDIWRDRTDSNVWVEAMLDLASTYKVQTWGVPRDQMGMSIGPFLRKRMHERRTYFMIEELSEAGGDKQKKGRAIQARAASGKVYMPAETAQGDYIPPIWLADAMSELLMFPLGKHDDVHDALSIIGRLLDTMVGASKAQNKAKASRDAYDRSNDDEQDSMLA